MDSKEALSEAEAFFLKLLSEAIHNKETEAKEEEIRLYLRDILRLSSMHMMRPLIIDHLYRFFPALLERYKKSAVKLAVAQAYKTASFLLLYEKMKENGLPPLVMKGIICRNLYKNGDLRPSTDEDLLISPEETERYHDFLIKEGFVLAEDTVSLKEAYEISYKHPERQLYLEIHKHLFPLDDPAYGELNELFREKEGTVIVSVYGTDIKTQGYTDHFLYLVCHAYKHLIYSGIGIRQLCDMTLFIERYGKKLNWQRVLDSCKEKKLLLFLQAILKICTVHLGLPIALIPSELYDSRIDEIPLLKDILSGGIYGAEDKDRLHSANITLSAVSAYKQGEKEKGIWNSLFPSFSYMAKKYPYLNKRTYLLPFAWSQRIVSYLFSGKTKNDPARTVGIGKRRVDVLKKYGIIL